MFGINKKLKQVNNKNDKKSSTQATKVSKKPAIIPDLICKSFVDGCLVLGCIHDILSSELIVSLPGIGNFGYIKINNISKIYSHLLKNSESNKKGSNSNVATLLEMFNKGDLVRCKVLNYTNNKLYLTIEPDQLNSNLNFSNLEEEMILSGSIKTKEDHGYTIDLGIENLTGFFKTKNQNLPVGQTSLFKIVNKASKRAINLKLCDSTENCFYNLKTSLKFDTYLPGAQLDNCTIEKIGKNGLHLNIPNQLYGYVHINHVPLSKRTWLTQKTKKLSEVEKNKPYSSGDKVNGTIIFINPYSKLIYLSLLPHLNDSTKPAKISRLFINNEESLKLGQIIEDAQVNLHTHKGIYLKFKGPGSKQIIGFVPKRHLFEKNDLKGDEENQVNDDEDATEEKLKKVKKDSKNMTKEDLEEHFPINSIVKARIYDFSLIEDIILLSCRPSVLNASFMTYEELSVGKVVKCTVKKINTNNGGVTVKLSDFINGFIPKIHTGDIPLSEALLSKKLQPGSEIKCKIIQLSPEEKRCVLTAKKSLIKSKLDLIDSFDKLSLGLETYGVVVSIQKYGLILSFLNDVKGLLPRNEISNSLKPNEDLNELYYLGQLIKCKILDFNKEKQQIKLSLMMDDSKKKLKELKNNSKNDVLSSFEAEYEIGDLIESGTILQVSQDSNYFRVKLPKGTRNGIIYKSHLSDLDSLNDILFEYYKTTMKMNNLMIIQYPETSKLNKLAENNSSKTKSCHYLTLKTSVIDFYTNIQKKADIPKSFEDLKINTWHHGWLKKILSNGLLVELPHNLNGFSGYEHLNYSEELKSSNINGLAIGQSVLVKIANLFNDKKRFVTNVKTRHDLSQKNVQDQTFMIEYFKSYLNNIKNLFQEFSNSKSDNKENASVVQNGSLFTNKQFWEKLSQKVKIGSIVDIAVKNFNKSSGQIECLFLNDLEENNYDSNSNLIGYAFANPEDTEEDVQNYKQGSKLKALVIGFDPIARAFCLTVNKKSIKTYSKNFDSKFRSQIVCKQDQSVKAEIIYVSQWFCIVGLKQHALGRLAYMPLFKNDFTQLNTFSSLNDPVSELAKNKFDLVDSKIKQKQVLAVSSACIESISFNSVSETATDKLKEQADSQKLAKDKANKKFSYFYVGELIKCIIKQQDENLDYLIAFNDTEGSKKSKKQILRQLAILNESHVQNETGLKRKSDEGDEPVIVKKKLVLSQDKKGKRKSDTDEKEEDNLDHIEVVTNVKISKTESDENNIQKETTESFLFPWEVTDFDHFNELINKATSSEDKKEEKDTKTGKNKDKQNQKDKKVLDDRLIYENEEQVFDPSREPENSDDFERMIASKPNCSLLWIKYMVFYLQMAEIEKARGVAQQALKTIIYKEDQERLNVWVALLNLENMYGDQSALEQAFNKATQNCDSYKVYCHMAEIFARSNKLQEAETIFIKMTRKFSQSTDAWIKYGIFHYKNSNCELARKLLIKSFNSLDKKDHIDMVNKFAQLEFKYGDVERAKTMYDSLLFTYPNRTDIWSVYIDMLVKHEKYDDARQIFDRIIQLGLTVKRMKFIFKKYLDFEKLHGNDELVEKVKELATKYVENNSSKAEDKQNESNNSTSMQENLKKNLKI